MLNINSLAGKKLDQILAVLPDQTVATQVMQVAWRNEIGFEEPVELQVVGNMVKINCGTCPMEHYDPQVDRKFMGCQLTNFKLGTRADYMAHARICPIAKSLQAAIESDKEAIAKP